MPRPCHLRLKYFSLKAITLEKKKDARIRMQARKWGLFIANGGLLVRYSSLAAKQPSVGNLFCWLLSCIAKNKYNVNLQNIMQKSVSPEHNVKVCGKTTGAAFRRGWTDSSTPRTVVEPSSAWTALPPLSQGLSHILAPNC